MLDKSKIIAEADENRRILSVAVGSEDYERCGTRKKWRQSR
jgi:hypothetical protein